MRWPLHVKFTLPVGLIEPEDVTVAVQVTACSSIFHQRTAIICESWMSFWDPSNPYPRFRRPTQSSDLPGFRYRLSRGPRFFPSCCGSFPLLGCRFNWRWQLQFGLFRRAMVAMVQRLDARSFFGHPQLIVSTFSALVLKVCRNRFSCHGPSVAELSPSKLSSSSHLLRIHGPPRGGGRFWRRH
jgi:hypothetical protein